MSERRYQKLLKLIYGSVAFLVFTIIILSILLSKKTSFYRRQICTSKSCIKTANMMLQNMNFNVNPCENFYEFSCGNFQKNTRIPDDQSRVDTFDTLRERLAYNLADLLSMPVKQNDNKSIKKVKDLFNSCLDEENIDKIGEERLLNFIQNELFGWPILSEDSDYKFVSSLDKMKKMRLFDTHFIFDLMISPSPKFPSTSLIRLSQPYWFFNKELYNDPSTVSAYKSFMQKIIELFSPNNRDLKNDIEKIFNLEKDFGMKQIDENLRRNLVHKKFTLRELEIKLPKFEWKKYFNKIFNYSNNISIDYDEQILIDDWEYIEQAVDVYHDALKNRPKDLDNLMIWVFIKDRTTMLPKKFKDTKLEFDRITKGTISSLPRSLICSNFVLETMEFAVGRLYVENYFNNASKDAATEMILNIQNEFKNMLKQLDWMDSKSKQLAIDKANNIDIRIGFPEFSYNNTYMEDLYNQYSIDPNEFFINFMNILKADTIENLNKLRKTNNRSEWLIGPAIVNAFYSTPNNQICFPAGILQFPFYDVENPNYLNYGGIGSVIGHEITHGFDDRGRLYDKNGVFHEDESAGLWTNETVEKYKKKVECFVDQYNSYHSTQVNRTIDGLQTCGENIADNGGIKQSFRAYRKWVEEHGEESILPGLNFNQEQLFFINYAQVWCGKFRDQNLMSRIINGQHSPAEFRVIGPTSNLKEFSEVFSCKKGHKNNPAKKCSVW